MSEPGIRRLRESGEIKLTRPSLPQAAEEQGQRVIHVDDFGPDEKITVRVLNDQGSNWHPTPGDTLRAYLNDTPSENVLSLDDRNVFDAFWDGKFDPATIPDGSYTATYRKTSQVGDIVAALPATVVIAGSSASEYRSPLFPDAQNGVLPYAKIAAENGAPIRTQYALCKDDQVTFYWQGFDESGNAVAGAAYRTDPPHTVQVADLVNGYVADTIPMAGIRPLGDLGSGVAYYEVRRQGVTHASLRTEVVISWSDLTALQLTCTQGAANASSQLPNLIPCNYGVVFGEPGLAVTISASLGGVILEAEGSDPTTYRTRLDWRGVAAFSVSSNDQTLISLAAYAGGQPGDAPTVDATFSPYLDGSAAGICAYAYTTRVPSDGNTACSIYFQVSPEFVDREVEVAILDDHAQATIVGADTNSPHTYTTMLYADGSGCAGIVDTCEEEINVALRVVGESTSLRFPHPVRFSAFPPTPGHR